LTRFAEACEAEAASGREAGIPPSSERDRKNVTFRSSSTLRAAPTF
jgi:hypothetical protein